MLSKNYVKLEALVLAIFYSQDPEQWAGTSFPSKEPLSKVREILSGSNLASEVSHTGLSITI